MTVQYKTLITIGLAAALAGCGGGGGGSSMRSTVIDGFNMTKGTPDVKKGADYIQAYLTENSIQDTTVDDVYSRLNVPGVAQAHASGWTGKGKTITVLDGSFDEGEHGYHVSLIAGAVAPGATANLYNIGALDNAAKNITTMASDVVTISVSYSPSQQSASPSLANYVSELVTDLEASDALATLAAQHSNWTGTRADVVNQKGQPAEGRGGYPTCPNDIIMTVENCNSWAIKGLDSNNVIYVGEVDANNHIPNWSNQAGNAHKAQFIVTSADYVTTDSDKKTHGNSFAAPRVAGAGLLVRHKFPNLSGAETATVILHTADDLGDPGVDRVYGHGKLNVGKALAPVGSLH